MSLHARGFSYLTTSLEEFEEVFTTMLGVIFRHKDYKSGHGSDLFVRRTSLEVAAKRSAEQSFYKKRFGVCKVFGYGLPKNEGESDVYPENQEGLVKLVLDYIKEAQGPAETDFFENSGVPKKEEHATNGTAYSVVFDHSSNLYGFATTWSCLKVSLRPINVWYDIWP